MPVALFDLDGTLVDQADAARRWAAEFGEAHRLTGGQTRDLADRLAERRSKGLVFAEIVKEFALDADPQAVWDAYRARMPVLVRCPPETLGALAALRAQGWTIGIVTNGEVDNQEGKIRRTGLADAVDGWVISGEAGVRKPEPAIFALAAERLGHPLRGWMIGDSLDADVVGGQAAGLRTVWITSGAAPAGESVQPTFRAASVSLAVRHILAEGEELICQDLCTNAQKS